jgi:hypothetical protein
MFRSIAVALVAASVLLLSAAPSDAIPAFARKYQFSCSTCHSPAPRLKPFGEEFAARGFRLEDPSQEPPRATYDLGDPTLKLMRELPLAVRLEGYASVGEKDSLHDDAQFPWVFKVLSGGQINQQFSYYFYYIIETGGGGGLEDAWIQINKPFKLPIDLSVGQFQVCDPLFKRELRLERSDYQIFKTHVGDAAVDLTYDRGLIVSWDFPGGIESVLQVVNGNGIEMADDFDNFDKDNLKNFAYRVAKPFKKGRVGLFGYYGREAGSGDIRNRTFYFGPDAVVDFSDHLQLNLQYLERRDDNPTFLSNKGGTDWKTRGGFAELVYLPLGADGPWSIAGLYNKVASDDPNAKYHSLSLTVGRLLARNIRLTADIGREFESQGTKFSVGLVTVF